MSSLFRVTVSAGVLALFTQQAAAFSAEEAWQAWQDQSNAAGQSLTAESQDSSADGLTVSGVVATIDVPDGKITMELEEVLFTEQGDGSVVMTFSDSYDIALNMQVEPGGAGEMNLRVTQPGASVVVAEAEDGVAYTFDMPELTVTSTGFEAEGKQIPFELTVTGANVEGVYTITEAQPLTFETTLSMSSLGMDFSGRDPESGGNTAFKMTMNVADLTTTSTGKGGMMWAAGEQLPALLEAGLSTSGRTKAGPFELDVDVVDPNDSFKLKMTGAGGGGSLSLDKSQVSYDVVYEDLAASFSGSQIPLPMVETAFQTLGITFLMPIQKSDTFAPYTLNTSLENMTIGDPVWNLFDPAAVLPRDPATLQIDLSGKLKWLIDILDPLVAAAPPNDQPAEVESLSMSNFLLRLAGAELTGQGAFTFDNSDYVTIPGMPKPTGSANFKLVGGNGLLDRLVQMGLVPQDQAMGVRLMSGMFLRPGDGPDTLESVIEVTEDGGILANGQKIR